MTTINLEEFTHYNLSGIKQFLSLQSDALFKIIYPKNIEDLAATTTLAFEYFNAALAGEMLASVSPKLSYDVPSEYFDENFSFIIKVENWESFASTLHYLAKSLDHGSTHFFKFQDQLSAFLESYAQNTLKPFCMGLFWTGIKYH